MACRSAVLIDNFLEQSKFDALCEISRLNDKIKDYENDLPNFKSEIKELKGLLDDINSMSCV